MDKAPITTTLPPLYDRWMRDFLPGPIPEETQATCAACAMCASTSAHKAGAWQFNPSTKCCTYTPALPNFLVGQILAEPDGEAGRESIETRIEAGRGTATTPVGLFQLPTYHLLYNEATQQPGTTNAFGRSIALRCPHYLEAEGGLCAIWQHREAVCSTYFCKHVRGSVGRNFWINALKPFLQEIERELAYWCLLELKLNSDAIAQTMKVIEDRTQHISSAAIRELDPALQQAAAQAMWGNWYGKEMEFYIACGKLIHALSWPEILALCGTHTRLLALLTSEAYNRLTSPQIPAQLVTGQISISEVLPDSSRVVTYGPTDPVDVPSILMNLLPYFDGQPTADVLKRILEEEGIELDEGLLRKLVDFEILVPLE